MDTNNEKSSFILNISEEVVPKRKSKGNKIQNEVNNSFTSQTKPQTKLNIQTSPVKQNKKKNEKFPVGGSGLEHFRTSSIFKSNPDIPFINVEKQNGVSEPLFSKKTFEDINVHSHLVSCLKSRLKITLLTTVQEKAIPVLLEGRDSLIKSCTGSGKTLAYAVPIVQKLQEISPKINRSDGTFSLIVVPTRELALQCFECFSTLTKAFTWIVPGYLIGGEKKKSEKARLRRGINILISTPGRLLDHLEHTECLSLQKIQWLIIDEADKLLEQGFEDSITRILSNCQNSRQTVLLSATLSKGVEKLAGMSLTNPVHIDVASENGRIAKDFQEFAVPGNLKQSVVIVPSKLRLTVMSAFIVDKYMQADSKGLIFMCSQSSVNFHCSLLSGVLGSLLKDKGHKCKFLKLHGNMKQEERTEIFRVFRSAKQGILLCTDVAARGLDLPHVDWIMQYSIPSSVEIYVHRIGRTARIGKKGSALLFLLPTEVKFIELLNKHKIEFEKIDAVKILQSLLLVSDGLGCRRKISPEDCATALQTQYEKEVYAEDALHQSAKDAFCSYIQYYSSHPKHMKDVLPFKEFHLGHVAKSYCLREAPSELSLRLPKTGSHSKYPRKSDVMKQQKRKHTVISEYDSGLSALKQSQSSAPKRRKYK